jgi:hypothetical protein
LLLVQCTGRKDLTSVNRASKGVCRAPRIHPNANVAGSGGGYDVVLKHTIERVMARCERSSSAACTFVSPNMIARAPAACRIAK